MIFKKQSKKAIKKSNQKKQSKIKHSAHNLKHQTVLTTDFTDLQRFTEIYRDFILQYTVIQFTFFDAIHLLKSNQKKQSKKSKIKHPTPPQ